jgi:hypothetical protein
MEYNNYRSAANTSTEMSAKMFLKKYAESSALKEVWRSKFEEAYEYTMPGRESFYEESPGQKRTDRIFDETAVVGIQEFASRLQAGITPTFGRWINLKSGIEIPSNVAPEIDEQLDSITQYVFEVLHNSNFNQEVHEAFMDCAIGTGCLLVNEGTSSEPIVFNAIPLPHVTLNSGPNNKIDCVYRKRQIRLGDIKVLYPNAELDEVTLNKSINNPDQKISVIEGTMRNYADPNKEVYDYIVCISEHESIIVQEQYKGAGSNPFITFRWNKASGEVYGRGPVFNAMAAIKTTNLTVELILENAQMNISGIYQLEDDGVINTDNISLVPGTIIPVAPGSRGLQPIQGAGRFDVAQLVLEDMRNNIRKALYMDTLGPTRGTPMSATEVAERMADLSRQIGSSFGRLQSEFIQPLIKRVIYILKKQGRIEIPSIDNKEIKIIPESPLSRAQNEQDIADVNRFNATLGQTFGPEVLNLIVKQEEVARYLAEKMNLPEKLIRDAAEQQQVMQQMQQLQQMQQMQGGQVGLGADTQQT